MRKLLVLMGVPIDDLDMPAALTRIEEFIQEGRLNGTAHQVVTVNADFVINARRDPELRQILQEADMATADGMPLVWSARRLGVLLPGRVTGADLVPALAGLAAERGFTLYLLGSGPRVAARAAEVLLERYPNLSIVGAVSPPYRSVLDADPALVHDIRKARPDVLLVAFGNPKQEKWIAMHAPELGVPVMIGVGGTLDFIAGVARRAPEWMQRYGLEWAYRLAQEPRRLWRRYAVDLLELAYFFCRQWWALRRPAAGAETIVPTGSPLLIDGIAVIAVERLLTLATRDSFLLQAEGALAQSRHLIVDLTRTEFLDSSGYGALVALAKRARVGGGEVHLAGEQPQVERGLKLLRLDHLFEGHPDASTALAAVTGRRQPEPEAEAAIPGVAVLGGWGTIKAPRRLDAMAAPAFKDECSALLAVRQCLIVDLSETIFLASAGLAILVALTRDAQARGGELRLASLTPDALRVVKIAKLEGVLSLYPSLAVAAR